MVFSVAKSLIHVNALMVFRTCSSHLSARSIKTHQPRIRTCVRHYCTPQSSDSRTEEEGDNTKKGGFAKAYDKFSSTQDARPEESKEPTFQNLLKNSKFIDLGDPEGKVVTGTIFHVVEDDLYVDFGWKFHCVVTRPAKNGHEYVRGAKVRLSIKDLELSSRFLGSEKDLTLLEADAILLGLVSSPARANLSKSQ